MTIPTHEEIAAAHAVAVSELERDFAKAISALAAKDPVLQGMIAEHFLPLVLRLITTLPRDTAALADALVGIVFAYGFQLGLVIGDTRRRSGETSLMAELNRAVEG
jgi:hypothetical protein